MVNLALLNSEDLEDGDGDVGDVGRRDGDDGDDDHGDIDKRDSDDGNDDHGYVGKRNSDDGDDDCNGSAGNHRHRDIFLSHISLL